MAAGTFTVNSEIRIEAPPESVFPFLTDPQKIVRWKGVDATVEASPGGVYRVNVTGTNHAVGEYVEVAVRTALSGVPGLSSSPGGGRGTNSCRQAPRLSRSS